MLGPVDSLHRAAMRYRPSMRSKAEEIIVSLPVQHVTIVALVMNNFRRRTTRAAETSISVENAPPDSLPQSAG